MQDVLFKIKAIALATAILAIGGAATYLATDVDYVEAFGPTAGAVLTTVVGYLVKDKLPAVIAYLDRLRKQPVA